MSNPKDTIEFIDGDLDITGWDLRKCLKLLKKSNIPLIERFQSPIEYYADAKFKEGFKFLIERYYSPIASFYHHYSLASKFWEELREEENVKLKSYFYLIRSLLSCNWIVRDSTVLPMSIEGLMKYIDDGFKEYLKSLIALKATVGEKYLHRRDEKMQNLILGLFEFIEINKNDLGVNNQDYTLTESLLYTNIE